MNMIRLFAVFFLAVSALGHAFQPVKADDQSLSTKGLSSVIEQARKEGVRVVIVDPGTKVAKAKRQAPLLDRMQKSAREIRERFFGTLQAIPVYWSHSYKALQNGGGDRTILWPLGALGIAIGLLAVGWLPAWLFSRWSTAQFRAVFDDEPTSKVAKISYLYLSALSEVMEVVIQIALALTITMLLNFEPWTYRFTIFLVFLGWASYRLSSLMFAHLFSVRAPQYRILSLNDNDARSMYQGARLVFVPMIVVMVGCVWQEILGMDHNAHLLSLIVATAISALFLAGFVVTHREPVARLIRGERGNAAPVGQRLLASSWHLLALAYIAIAYTVMFGRLVLGLPNAMFLAIGPLLAVLGAISAYGALLWLVEWVFQRRTKAAFVQADIHSELDTEGELDPLSLEPSPQGLVDSIEEDASPNPLSDKELPSYRGLFVKTACLLALLGSGGWLLNTWGISIVSPDASAAAIWKVLLLAFFAYLTWGAIKVAFDRKIAQEGGDIELVPGEEGGGAGSRLGTLLPLIRNFVLILLSAIVVMMVLGEMGVNVGPIFACAGIVGLAIGFGAQTLVKDIISGVFFLVDDAFRKGEYIDIGTVKGTVEKISVRSMQLRHHNGPLHTVPFGDLGHVTNFSRDWVVMKLPLRLTYDTDSEMVRKLIKKLGQEMQADEVLGPMFLQPLKSQGVIQMEDSAMIMRVKFMTRPGDQWGIRRIVFARIRDLFEEKGIRFASREVTVRLADEDKPARLDEKTHRAVSGSAARIIQDADPSPAGAS